MAANAASIPRSDGFTAHEPRVETARVSAATYGYAAAVLTTFVGWILTRENALVDPFDGVGYWLGIVGASLMALLLLYPVRKRIRMLRFLGATKYWFRIHMTFGVLGPLLILYHCNFKFGSLSSNVALVCTLVVAGSGLVGRYMHSKIYSDLAGHRRSLKELGEKARLTSEQIARATKLAPDLIERMNRFDGIVLTPPEGFLASLLLPVKLSFTTRIGFVRLAWYARGEIRREAARLGITRAKRRRVQRAVCSMIANHLRRVRRVSEFHSYERLFSLWHVFHLPFFYILIVAAVIHVLAVHMY